jgi:hypothetical protein
MPTISTDKTDAANNETTAVHHHEEFEDLEEKEKKCKNQTLTIYHINQT